MWQRLRAVFLLYGGILLFWTGYRYFFTFPEAVDEFLVKPIVFLLPVLVMLRADRKSLTSLGMAKSVMIKHSLIGILVGLGLVGEKVIIAQISGVGLSIDPFYLGVLGLMLQIFISLATALTEEIVFRGYLLERIYSVSDNELLSCMISSLLFVVIHLPLAIFQLHDTIAALGAYTLLIFELGMITAFLYTRTRSITAPVWVHLLWNFSNRLLG